MAGAMRRWLLGSTSITGKIIEGLYRITAIQIEFGKACRSQFASRGLLRNENPGVTMTLQIFVSLITLGLVCWNLYRLTQSIQTHNLASWLILLAMLPVWIILSYVPGVRLSHFVFELCSNHIQWYRIVYVPLWLLAGHVL